MKTTLVLILSLVSHIASAQVLVYKFTDTVTRYGEGFGPEKWSGYDLIDYATGDIVEVLTKPGVAFKTVSVYRVTDYTIDDISHLGRRYSVIQVFRDNGSQRALTQSRGLMGLTSINGTLLNIAKTYAISGRGIIYPNGAPVAVEATGKATLDTKRTALYMASDIDSVADILRSEFISQGYVEE